ncbi:hypothetical protein [Desulfuromonas acetoxidans]|uniref:Uncharacterized protein n=1 Tax=Desulfuromonas acetoxidans (strain DSM 684 / 11070) TaxID=281689 RepID=Q1JYF2_DESA6|nr:hypothetical protein [Desulfuromonas acetoxidans]EAT15254.1 conserved hypothetical protein [Desulfuromonas acetoxidans DSM 684]MBF0645360.1 hypothetical protein [Desulfuromonas acetoxidans]NVD23440.1 hypothetical protein [Desulfuromonas acetoxidans]NVE15319.1 hypothetical protein [Desulfuromonas acetoxidans]
MSISERYRDLVDEVDVMIKSFHSDEVTREAKRALQVLNQARNTLADLAEDVGEIPRMKIESQLSPVLLDAHNLLDRGRLLLEEQQLAAAHKVWDIQKKLYRLLNDL